METGIPSLRRVRDTHPAELAVVLSTVSADAVFGLPADAVEALVVATQKVASWAHGLQSMAVDRFAELTADHMDLHAAEVRARGGSREVPIPDPDAVAASSLAPLLNVAPRTMRTRLNRARLIMELPRTLGMALAGELEPWRVDAVVVAAKDVARDRLTEFEARLHDTDVSRLPKPRLADRARRAAAKADPDGTTRAHRLAHGRRGLRIAPSEVPGLMRWTADLPDHASRTLLGAVDALAQEYLTADRSTGARRTVEAARVDALTDLAMANATVETLVELVVPAAAAPTPSLVSRRDRLTVIRDHLRRPDGGATSDVIEADPVLVDLVSGNHTPSTLAAGQLERGHGLRLGEHLETRATPSSSLDAARRRHEGPRLLQATTWARCGSSTGSSRPQAPPPCSPNTSSPSSTTRPRACGSAPPTPAKPTVLRLDAAPTAHTGHSSPGSAPATATAGSPAARCPQAAASSTTSCPSRWGTPRRRTCTACAPPTTRSSTMPAGGSRWPTTAAVSGPPRPDAPTRPPRPPPATPPPEP